MSELFLLFWTRTTNKSLINKVQYVTVIFKAPLFPLFSSRAANKGSWQSSRDVSDIHCFYFTTENTEKYDNKQKENTTDKTSFATTSARSVLHNPFVPTITFQHHHHQRQQHHDPDITRTNTRLVTHSDTTTPSPTSEKSTPIIPVIILVTEAASVQHYRYYHHPTTPARPLGGTGGGGGGGRDVLPAPPPFPNQHLMNLCRTSIYNACHSPISSFSDSSRTAPLSASACWRWHLGSSTAPQIRFVFSFTAIAFLNRSCNGAALARVGGKILNSIETGPVVK